MAMLACVGVGRQAGSAHLDCDSTRTTLFVSVLTGSTVRGMRCASHTPSSRRGHVGSVGHPRGNRHHAPRRKPSRRCHGNPHGHGHHMGRRQRHPSHPHADPSPASCNQVPPPAPAPAHTVPATHRMHQHAPPHMLPLLPSLVHPLPRHTNRVRPRCALTHTARILEHAAVPHTQPASMPTRPAQRCQQTPTPIHTTANHAACTCG